MDWRLTFRPVDEFSSYMSHHRLTNVVANAEIGCFVTASFGSNPTGSEL